MRVIAARRYREAEGSARLSIIVAARGGAEDRARRALAPPALMRRVAFSRVASPPIRDSLSSSLLRSVRRSFFAIFGCLPRYSAQPRRCREYRNSRHVSIAGYFNATPASVTE